MWCDRFISFIKGRSTVPGAAVVFALAYILMLAVNAGQTGAAWVQAVGSVVAILVAIYVPYSLHKAEAQRAQRASVEKELGMALRLWKEVQALHLYLDNLLYQTEGINSLPDNIGFQYESMLMSLTQGFNDDLNPERIELLVKVRLDLSIVVRILSDREIQIGDVRRKLRDFSSPIKTYSEDAERIYNQVKLEASSSLT